MMIRRVLAGLTILAIGLLLANEFLERRGRANAETALRVGLDELAAYRRSGHTRIEYWDFGPDELRGIALSGYTVNGYDKAGFDLLSRSWAFDLQTARGAHVGLEVHRAPPGWVILCCARDGRL